MDTFVIMALIATLGTWFVTALGAATVVFFKSPNTKILNLMMGFASGVMIAASIWSLLIPSIEMAEEQGIVSWIPATIGFLCGIVFLILIDRVIPQFMSLLGMQ